MDFDELLDRYEKPVFNLIYRLVGDIEEAADLTQDTFVAAYRSIGEFRGESSVYTWLYRIAVNKCRNRFRQRDRRRACEGVSLDQVLDAEKVLRPAENSHLSLAPETSVMRNELRDRIERAISQLPPDYRVVAVLRDLHGLSYEQVSQATGLSVDVVRTRLARARGMLRRKLEAYLIDQG